MKNYWILTRVMLKNMMSSLNPFASIYETKQKRSKAILKAALILLVMLGAVGSVIYIEYLLYKGLNSIRMKEMLPALAILSGMVLTLVLGLFQGLSELFQGKDAPFLAVLPLTSRQVFAARMTTLYLSECEINALICIPAFVLYAVGSGSAWPVALTGLPVLLMLPLIPLSLVSLVASLLMRISVFSRHRETIVMILSMGIAIAYSVGVTLMSGRSTSGPEELVKMLMSQEGLIQKLTGAFPPAEWALKGLTGNWGMLLLLAAVSAACVAGVIALVGPGYLNQALSSTEKTVVHSRRARGEFAWNRHGALSALHSLEWKEILRTPAWAYNALAGVVMFPLMISIGLIAGLSGAGKGGLEEFRGLIAQVDQGYAAVVTAGVLMFGSMVNPAVSTGISREGGRWPFALTLPVQQKTRFMAKLLVGVEINLICSTLLAIVAYVLVRIDPLWLLAALGVSWLVSLAAGAISLWVDAVRPQLSWASEMEAIKKNFNQVFGMLLWVVLVALCVVPAIFLWGKGSGVTMLGIAGVAVVETAVCMWLLFRQAEKHAVMRV